MTFDPEEWLKVAEICCSNIPAVNREALLRTALNRAYYAALLTLKLRIDLAQGRGTVPQWQTHDAIKQAVRVGGEAFREISLVLNQLRRLRERADYLLDSEELELGLPRGGGHRDKPVGSGEEVVHGREAKAVHARVQAGGGAAGDER